MSCKMKRGVSEASERAGAYNTVPEVALIGRVIQPIPGPAIPAIPHPTPAWPGAYLSTL